MNTKRVKERAVKGTLTPGHSFILDFLKEKKAHLSMKGFLFTFGALIDQAVYLAYGAYGEVNGLCHAHHYVRDSLVKSIQDFGRVYMKNPH